MTMTYCKHRFNHIEGCPICTDEARTYLAAERWWSGEPGLLLPWYVRDEERARCLLPPDGLWNGPTPCGATICGIREGARADAEELHRETCRHGCASPTRPA